MVESDSGLIRSVRDLLGFAQEAFSAHRRGQKVTFQLVGGKTLQGSVMRAGGWWVELKVEEKDDKGKRVRREVIVDFADLTRASIAELLKERKGAKRARVAVARKLAILLLKLWREETCFDWAV